MGNIYKPSTCFAVVKTGLPNLCMQGLDRFFSCQNRPRTALQTFNSASCSQNCFAQLLRAFNRICRSQNVYHDLLQTFNRLCGSQHMYYDLLQAFNRHCSCQNWFAEYLHAASISSVALKTGLSNFHRPSTTGFAVLQTDFLNLCRAFNRFFSCQNGLTTSPHIYNSVNSIQNAFAELLQAFNNLSGS